MTTTDVTEAMTADEVVALTKRHTIFSWSAQASVNPIPMVRGEGIYFWDADGKRYVDMNSQLMCVNIGHGNRRVIDAIKRQAEELAYAGPGMATPVRARVGRMLADLTPGDLNRFFLERHSHRQDGERPPQDHGPLPVVPRSYGRVDLAHRRSEALGE